MPEENNAVELKDEQLEKVIIGAEAQVKPA